jgi:hypothetical protein
VTEDALRRVELARLGCQKRWRNGERRKEITASARSARPAFDFLFLFRGWTHTDVWQGRVGGRAGPLAAWMAPSSPQGRVHGVPARPPARPSTCFSISASQPQRGCAVGWKLSTA